MKTTISPDNFLDEQGNPRRRNMIIATLVEGDVIMDGDELQHVADGEVLVFADGTMDLSKGELAEIDRDGLAAVIGGGGQIFNMADVK